MFFMKNFNTIFFKALDTYLHFIVGTLDYSNTTLFYDSSSHTLKGQLLISINFELFDADCALFLLMWDINQCYVDFSFDLSNGIYNIALLLLDPETNDACPSICAYLKELILRCLITTTEEFMA